MPLDMSTNHRRTSTAPQRAQRRSTPIRCNMPVFLMMCTVLVVILPPLSGTHFVHAAGTRTLTPTGPSISTDLTLTESGSPSPLEPSLSKSLSQSQTITVTVFSPTLVVSSSESVSFTTTISSEASSTLHTKSHTPTDERSRSVTVSATETLTREVTVTDSKTVSDTLIRSTSGTVTETDDVTPSAGLKTSTLSETVTLTETSTRGSLTGTHSTSPTFSPTSVRSLTRSPSPTPSLVPTPDVSPSYSATVGTKTLTVVRTRTKSSSATATFTETATVSLSALNPSNTKSLTGNGTRSRTDSHTNVPSLSASVTGSPSNTISDDHTVSFYSGSSTLSVSLPQRRKALVNKTHTISFTGTEVVTASASPSAALGTGTETLTSVVTVSLSPSPTMISGSIIQTQTFSSEEVVTTSETVTNSSSVSHSRYPASSEQTLTRSTSASQTNMRTATFTRTVTRSSAKTHTVKTQTLTLTVSFKGQSKTGRQSLSKSLSNSKRTITDEYSESYSLTMTLSNTTTATLSPLTRVHTLTESVSGSKTAHSATPSPTQQQRSKSCSLTWSSDGPSRSATISPSTTVPRATVTERLTLTVARRGNRVSRSVSMSDTKVVTRTESVSIASPTRSIVVRKSLDNALLTAIQSVVFSPLASSSAPCMSLALYVELPLFLVFLVQLLALLVGNTLGWRVTVDTHREVPQWRSLLAGATYLSVFWPCHFRCGYAHTLRAMLQLLLLLVVLEALVFTIRPATTNVAAFCAAIALVTSQFLKPLTHLPLAYFRYPRDEELSARMHLAQMKRVLRLRKKELMQARQAERERRRAEGLDSATPSGSSDGDDPEFAYDTENVVAFDYMDNSVSLGTLRFGGGQVDVDFPDEDDVFGGRDALQLASEQVGEQLVGPGYVDVTFPGDEEVKVIDVMSERRTSQVGVDDVLVRTRSGGGMGSAQGSRSAHSLSSGVRDVVGVTKGRSPNPRKGTPAKKGATAARLGQQRSDDERSTAAKTPIFDFDSDPASNGRKSNNLGGGGGGINAYPSPTRAALALAEDDSKAGSSRGTSGRKRKPKKKRIGPGRDGVVVIPNFDDDLDAIGDDDDDDGDAALREDDAWAEKQLTPAKALLHSSDSASLSRKKHASASTAVVSVGGGDDDDYIVSTDSDRDGVVSEASKVSSASRFRLEAQPIVTYYGVSTVVALVVCGVLLFAADRFRTVCDVGFEGNFSSLWGITAVVDITFGDLCSALIVYAHRRLLAGGDEGDRILSCLHPYNGERRFRVYEHLSKKFLDNEN